MALIRWIPVWSSSDHQNVKNVCTKTSRISKSENVFLSCIDPLNKVIQNDKLKEFSILFWNVRMETKYAPHWLTSTKMKAENHIKHFISCSNTNSNIINTHHLTLCFNHPIRLSLWMKKRFETLWSLSETLNPQKSESVRNNKVRFHSYVEWTLIMWCCGCRWAAVWRRLG